MGNTVLITGGKGFIGSHLKKKLMNMNFQVEVIDLKSGDDLTKLSESKFRKINPDVIFHLASYNNVHESMSNPLKYLDNIKMTERLLHLAKHLKSKIIFTSSCAVYGEQSIIPIKEDSKLCPINFYGFTKMACEALIRNYDDYVILRLGNVYGKGSGIFAQKIPKLEKPVIYVDENGNSLIRDYVHVEDVVEALIKSIEVQNEVMNIGTSSGVSYLQIAKHFRKQFIVQDKPPYIPSVIILENKKARETLNWNPREFNFEALIS